MSNLVGLAGFSCCTQAAIQIIMNAISLAQYYCVIDFLQNFPFLIYIKILYYHNASTCGQRINIGQTLSEVSNQAFVLLRTEPFTATRTFYANCVYLTFGCLWFLSGVFLIANWSINKFPKIWHWVITTIGICVLDVLAIITLVNDSFFTKTLNDMMTYIGATASGIGNTVLDTRSAAWIMIALYARLGIFFLFNVVILIVVTIKKRNLSENLSNVTTEVPIARNDVTFIKDPTWEERDRYSSSSSSESSYAGIPRPVITMQVDPDRYERARFIADVIEAPILTGKNENVVQEFKMVQAIPGVGTSKPNQPLSQSMQLRRLSISHSNEKSKAIVAYKKNDVVQERKNSLGTLAAMTSTANQPSTSSIPPPPSSSKNISVMPRVESVQNQLQQLPWSYIPSTSVPMRSQLPPDEDLPPIPLPDYTLAMNPRKASVHKSPEKLQRIRQRVQHPPPELTSAQLKKIDVLY